MKFKIYTIYDNASESYSKPMFLEARGVALRSVMDAIAEPNTVYNKHPEHFSMFEIGEFHNDSATFDIYASPQLVANFWELG